MCNQYFVELDEKYLAAFIRIIYSRNEKNTYFNGFFLIILCILYVLMKYPVSWYSFNPWQILKDIFSHLQSTIRPVKVEYNNHQSSALSFFFNFFIFLMILPWLRLFIIICLVFLFIFFHVTSRPSAAYKSTRNSIYFT